MKRLVLGVVILVVGLAMVTAPVQGQRQGKGKGKGGRFGGGGGFSTLMLVGQKSVQEELKMTEEQVKKVGELAEKQRGSFQDLQNLSREERKQKFEELAKANDKAVGEILKPEQLKRVKEITLQQRGTRAFGEAEVASAMKFTDEQKDKVKTILEDSMKDMRELFQGGNQGNREEARRKMTDLRKATDEKLTSLLTDEQKSTWKGLTGEPFKGEITPFGRPGGRRRPNNQSN